MALVKDKQGQTKDVSDFVAANNQLLIKYGYTRLDGGTPTPATPTTKSKKKAPKPAASEQPAT